MAVSTYTQYHYTSLPSHHGFWVYRVWSIDSHARPEILHYVGQSTCLKPRIFTHNMKKLWPKQYFIDAATCCAYQEMCAEEKIQIYTMQPTLNTKCKNLSP